MIGEIGDVEGRQQQTAVLHDDHSNNDEELYERTTVDSTCSLSKMYSCSFPSCNAVFTSASNQKRHEKVHQTERPYKCPYVDCQKAFSRKYDMKVHTRTHTKEKPYHCEVSGCGKFFSRNSSLREHERNVHHLMNTSRRSSGGHRIKTTTPIVQQHSKQLQEQPCFSDDRPEGSLSSDDLCYSRADILELVRRFQNHQGDLDSKQLAEILPKQANSSQGKELIAMPFTSDLTSCLPNETPQEELWEITTPFHGDLWECLEHRPYICSQCFAPSRIFPK